MAKEYGELIRDELQQEQEAAAQFYQRGMSVVTTAGAMVTLFGGLIAIAGSKNGFHLKGTSIALLIVAGAGFLTAIALALYGLNAPFAVVAAESGALQDLINQHWSESSFKASQSVADLRVEELRRLRRINRTRATLLLSAYGFVVAAVLLLVLSIVLSVA